MKKEEVSLSKFLVFIFMFFLFLMWFISRCADMVEVKAAVVTGETPLGGMSKALDEFYDAGGELYDNHDLDVLSAAMQLENGGGSDECLLYTGSVIINRRNKHWAETIEAVIFQGYHDSNCCQQYASHTVENLYTVEVSDRCRNLAIRLLLFGPIDSEVIYQSQYPHLGKNAFCIGSEWFAY